MHRQSQPRAPVCTIGGFLKMEEQDAREALRGAQGRVQGVMNAHSVLRGGSGNTLEALHFAQHSAVNARSTMLRRAWEDVVRELQAREEPLRRRLAEALRHLRRAEDDARLAVDEANGVAAAQKLPGSPLHHAQDTSLSATWVEDAAAQRDAAARQVQQRAVELLEGHRAVLDAATRAAAPSSSVVRTWQHNLAGARTTLREWGVDVPPAARQVEDGGAVAATASASATSVPRARTSRGKRSRAGSDTDVEGASAHSSESLWDDLQ